MQENLSPLIGGILIALSTTLLLALNGKIAGVSGILGLSIGKFKKEHFWRYAFLFGLIVGGLFGLLFFPQYFNYEINFTYSEALLSGVLVGFGSRLGSGCTSGHGVCGLPRLSIRSLAATLTFMSVAIITVYVRSLI